MHKYFYKINVLNIFEHTSKKCAAVLGVGIFIHLTIRYDSGSLDPILDLIFFPLIN